jgi:hypothetical protein
MRQIDEVHKAYLDGCRTSIEVAQRTGLPRSYCSAYTRDLFRSGFLIRVGVAPKKSTNGQCIYLYEPSPSYQDALHRPDADEPERFDRIIELFLIGADEQVNVNALRRAVAAMKEDVARLRLSVRRLHAEPQGDHDATTVCRRTLSANRQSQAGCAQYSSGLRRGGISLRQEPYINSMVAQHALAMLARLFRRGEIAYDGGFISQETGRVNRLPINRTAWE